MGHADREAFAAGIGQAAKKLDIQAGSAGRGRVPLHAESEPVFIFRLDAFHDAVQGAGADHEAAGHFVDCATVLAVDHNLAFTIQIGQAGAGHDGDRVPQPAFRRVPMLVDPEASERSLSTSAATSLGGAPASSRVASACLLVASWASASGRSPSSIYTTSRCASVSRAKR